LGLIKESFLSHGPFIPIARILSTAYSFISCSDQPDSVVLVLLLRRRKVAVFCDSTINDRRQTFLKGILKRMFFASVDGIFGYGTRSKEYVVHYGANPAKVFHRCQAAALPLDYSPDGALEQRLARAPPADAPRFLYVGRLSAEKGLNTLLAAFATVRADNNRACLVLVGSGPSRKALEQQAQSLGLGKSVQFAGSKSGDDLFKEYTRATS
jgi:glycosyltransferase involved in cell wall biosynthesis